MRKILPHLLLCLSAACFAAAWWLHCRQAIRYLEIAPPEGMTRAGLYLSNEIRHPNGILVLADGVVNPCPTAEELAHIAVATAETARKLCGVEEPRVAMLSFSTKGSAEHALVEKVREATAIAKGLAPTLLIDGELQLDAALVPEVGALKAPGSSVAGRANVLIFPDLQSGNIGYKIAQRLGGASCFAVLQGLARPCNDLSRGCSVEDIVNTVAATALQAR